MSAQLTRLLSNRTISRLERLRLKPLSKFTNRFTGAHLARKGGSSMEFADFRDYAPGDDLRFVDWNSFARLNRPYVKLFHEEEIIHYLILIDASESMRFEGKFERACELAAAFSLLALRHTERLSVRVLGDAAKVHGPCTGRASMRQVFAFLEGLSVGGQMPPDRAIEGALQGHRGRGVAVVLSDFLSDGDWRRSLTALFSAGLETIGVQILGRQEVSPALTGDQRLMDAELGTALDVSASGDLLTLYQEYRLAFEAHLAALCRSRSGRFISTVSDEPLDTLLFDRFRRLGWVV